MSERTDTDLNGGGPPDRRRDEREFVSAALVKAMADSAPCAQLGRVWADWEQDLVESDPGAERRRVMRSLEMVCDGCPDLTFVGCEQWARSDRYTGWAAGRAFVDGRAARRISGRRRGQVAR